jgi:hypothetical protein
MPIVGPARKRGGFALLGVVIIIATILIAAVAAVTSVAIVADHDRVYLAAKVLAQITDSSRYSVVRFQSDVGKYPGKLTQLKAALVSGDKNICYNNFTAAERPDWGGPYSIRSVSTSGLWTGIGMARDSLAKDPVTGNPSGGSPHALVILIDDVDEGDANMLNTIVDPAGEATPATMGRVRWGSASSEGRVFLQFRKTITSC